MFLVLLLTFCVTLGNSPLLPRPQLPCLYKDRAWDSSKTPSLFLYILVEDL